MSLDILEAKVQALREKADTLSKSYQATVRNIDSDPNLSEAGKAGEREEVRVDIRSQLSALRAQEEQLIEQGISERMLRIESRSGASSTDIIAFRDAQDRADRIEKQADALPVIDRALRQKDTSLAHAIFRRGLEANWRQVTDRFTQDHPDLADAVSELRALVTRKENTFERTATYAWLVR
ncbi:hypothetical protein [Microbacterium sp. Leaf179]|uniref:hypothetical protein n=1 Tax=Microbacterium sp. Leaf179 TaxID=1736288 RepID=UPI0006F63477|nr:hypothetical protein [Microbacterium sp. Leaf179]KQR88743.1 hypothetical protein ASF96_02950 [Microbacterium sp. Leaf179]